MKKSDIIIIWVLLVLFVICMVFSFTDVAGWSVVPHEDGTREIGVISNELNWQKDAKLECLNNLTYLESVQSALGYEKYCLEYDENIMALQEELDSVLAKDYETALGLVESRQAQ